MCSPLFVSRRNRSFGRRCDLFLSEGMKKALESAEPGAVDMPRHYSTISMFLNPNLVVKPLYSRQDIQKGFCVSGAHGLAEKA